MTEEGSGKNKGGGGDSIKKFDSSFPYFLGSQDNPGNVITHIQLRGENYDEWARSIRLSLKARRKFGIVDGTVTIPEEEERLDDWQTVNSMIVSWIMNTIESSLRYTISYHEEANLLWNDLKERLCVVNGPRIQQLKSALAECKQTKNESIRSYYGRLKQLWDELANYEALPSCECVKCTCDLGTKFARIQETDHLHRFLMGLENIYSAVRSNLLSLDPLPSLNRAYHSVTQEECLRGGTSSRPNEERDAVMVFKVQTDMKGKGKVDVTAKFCRHCNREGHEESGSFQLIGFPEWWGDRPRGGKGGGRGGPMAGRGRDRATMYQGRGKG